MQLSVWLKNKAMSNSEFARRIGGSPALIDGYLKRTIWPSRHKMKRIVCVTKGDVTPNDIFGLKESEAA